MGTAHDFHKQLPAPANAGRLSPSPPVTAAQEKKDKESGGINRVSNFLKKMFVSEKKGDKQQPFDLTVTLQSEGDLSASGKLKPLQPSALSDDSYSHHGRSSSSLQKPPLMTPIPPLSPILVTGPGSPGQQSPMKKVSSNLASPLSPLSPGRGGDVAGGRPGSPTLQPLISPTSPTSPSPAVGSGVSAARANAQPSSSSRLSSKDASTLLSVAPVLPPNMARPVWCLKDYAIVEKMYTGYASTVYKAWCKASGETVCLKSYNLANLCELNRFQIFREIKLHSRLQHENIITLYASFQQGDQVVLVQEFAESGDLFMLLHRYGGKLPEKTAGEMVLYPFLVVIHYLHQNCVVHRDIKPENVLFTRSMQLKLCDFGLALDLREERAVTRAGTLEYMAPEVLNCPFKNRPDENKEKQGLYYDLTVDTWAAGVLTYELLVGFPPFNDKERSAIEDKIRQETPRFPSTMSELARAFILKALQKDALERPTVLELIAHPWVKAHRRNASMRVLAPKPTSRKLHFEADADEDSSLPGAAARPKLKDMAEMRTADGDLLKPSLQTFLSFTAGSNRPKLPIMQEKDSLKPTKPASPPAVPTPSPKSKHLAHTLDMGTSGMSFSSAQNPKLQALRNAMH